MGVEGYKICHMPNLVVVLVMFVFMLHALLGSGLVHHLEHHRAASAHEAPD